MASEFVGTTTPPRRYKRAELTAPAQRGPLAVEIESSVRIEKDLVASNVHQNPENDNGLPKRFLRTPARV